MLKKYSRGHKVELYLESSVEKVRGLETIEEWERKETSFSTFIGDNKGDLTDFRKHSLFAIIQGYSIRKMSTYEIREKTDVENNELTIQFYSIKRKGKFYPVNKKEMQEFRDRKIDLYSQVIRVTVIIDGQEIEQQDLKCIINR